MLAKGQNAALSAAAEGPVHVVVAWADGSGERELDVSALVLGADHKVGSDADLVFYNQPTGANGSVRHLGKVPAELGGEDRVHLDLTELSTDVQTVAISASLDGEDGAGFGVLDELRLLVLDQGGQVLLTYDVVGAGPETALLLAEFYRRKGGWRVRAVGQGWADGLVGLATDYGITVDDDAAEAEPDLREGSGLQEDLRDPTPTLTDSADVVDVVPQADSVPLVAPTDTPQAGGPRSRGISTRRAAARIKLPALALAGDESWQAARLFSISGVGASEEQEKRATSAVLSAMMVVREFGRAVCTRFGAPAGHIETYIEVPFPLDEGTAQPDGVIRVAGRGGKLWTALVEVKTGSGSLRRDQVERYLDIAKAQGFDTVVTISNEIAPGAGEHPVLVDRRKTRKVALQHVSWAEILHDAQMQRTHRGVADAAQAWILSELIRYLEHPRSGAAAFEDMGASWVPVRQAVAAGSLRAADRKVEDVARSWDRLIRQLCLRLTSELGVEVGQVLPRKLASDLTARTAATVTRMVDDGSLHTGLRVPGAIGPIMIQADLRTGQLRTSVEVAAPREGGSVRRINWLLRQLKDAPDSLLVEAAFARRNDTTCELLVDVRVNPSVLVPDASADLRQLQLTVTSKLGTKRSGLQGAFIPSVNAGVETFYAQVVQNLKPWSPPAPKMPSAPDETDGEAATVVALPAGLMPEDGSDNQRSPGMDPS